MFCADKTNPEMCIPVAFSAGTGVQYLQVRNDHFEDDWRGLLAMWIS
jgi:hypothetical protein